MKTLARYAYLVVILFSFSASCKHHHHHHHQHRIIDEVVSVQLENQEAAELNLYKIQHLESQLSKTQNKLNMGTHESIIKAKKQAQDMTTSILDMVDDFTTQAQTNTKSQNKQNLKDLIRMKTEMEKSFKILNEGRAAGIKEVQKDVLGVTDEESDKLMEGMITDTAVKPAEEDPIPEAEPAKAKKTKKSPVKIAIEVPTEAEEAIPEEPAPAAEVDEDPIAIEPVVKKTKQVKTKVKKTKIPLSKVDPASIESQPPSETPKETPDPLDSDPTVPDSDQDDLDAKRSAEAEAKKLMKKQNDLKKKQAAAKMKKKYKSQKTKEIQEQELEVAKLDKELKRLEALAKNNQKAILKKNKEAAEQAKAKKNAKIAKEIATRIAKQAKAKADRAKKMAKQKADKAAALKQLKQEEDSRKKAENARIKAQKAKEEAQLKLQKAKIQAKADAIAAAAQAKVDAAEKAAADLEAARQRVIEKEKARQAKIDKQEMEDITRLTGMPHQTYEEYSKDLLNGVDSSNDDEFMKYLKTDNSDFDDSSTALPEFDYATSLSSKDVPKHESMFGQDKMETYDQIQKQMQIIQTILPKIKDAGKRAGLIKHFAPKMEHAMDSLEVKIKTESEKTKEPVKKIAQKKTTVQKVVQKKVKAGKKDHKKSIVVKKITQDDYSEIEKLAEQLSEQKFQKKLEDDQKQKKKAVHKKESKKAENDDLSKFDYQDEKAESKSDAQPQSVIQVTNKEDKEKLQKQENQIKDLEAKINALTSEKKDIEKTKIGSSSGNDLILPKLEALANKIENLEKIEKDRSTKDTSVKNVQKKEMDFDKSKIIEVQKLAESMQSMIQQAQKDRKEMEDQKKQSQPQVVKKQDDIKNHLETQGEINLSKTQKTPFQGNLDKSSTKGTISLLKKLI